MKQVNFTHLIEIRLYIEPNVAASAAARRTSADIAVLSDLLDRAEQRVGASVKEARLINVRFHDKVAQITANPLTIFLSQSITQVCSASLIQLTQDAVDASTVKRLIAMHRSILQSIIDRNPMEAFDRTKLHLLETHDMYSRFIPLEHKPEKHHLDFFKANKRGDLTGSFVSKGVKLKKS